MASKATLSSGRRLLDLNRSKFHYSIIEVMMDELSRDIIRHKSQERKIVVDMLIYKYEDTLMIMMYELASCHSHLSQNYKHQLLLQVLQVCLSIIEYEQVVLLVIYVPSN
ncbi:hypothetical protein LINPERPRIM_LOCUS2876 [Linum perenne]